MWHGQWSREVGSTCFSPYLPPAGAEKGSSEQPTLTGPLKSRPCPVTPPRQPQGWTRSPDPCTDEVLDPGKNRAGAPRTLLGWNVPFPFLTRSHPPPSTPGPLWPWPSFHPSLVPSWGSETWASARGPLGHVLGPGVVTVARRLGVTSIPPHPCAAAS